MTLDYRRGSPPPTPKRREPKPCFFWFVLGGMLGAFAVGLAWTSKTPPHAAHDGAAVETATSEAAEPSFYFYDILPELEVAVPHEEDIAPAAVPVPPSPPAAQPEPPPTTPAPIEPPEPAPDTGGGYLLQVASFKRPEEAARLQRRLAGLGIQTQIQTVTINNTDTYHRVRTGALANRDELGRVRDLLRRNGLESIAIKVK